MDLDDSTLSYDHTTRTLSIIPTGSVFRVQAVNGTVYSFTTTQTVTHADTEKLHQFYMDDKGTFVSIANPNRETQYDLMLSTVTVAFADWGSGSFQLDNIVTDMRKLSSGMSPNTTAKNFYDKQIYILQGGSVTDFPVTTAGDVDTDAQFGIGLGTMLFADRKYSFTAFSRGDTWRVMYVDGSSTRHINKVGFAFLTEGDFGTTTYDMPVYNNNGTPTMVDANNTTTERYVWYFMSCVNSVDQETKFVAWMGNNQYNSEAEADAGYSDDLATIEASTTILQEMSATYAVLYKTRRSYANTHKTYAFKYVPVKQEDRVGGEGTGVPAELVNGSVTTLHAHNAVDTQYNNTDSG